MTLETSATAADAHYGEIARIGKALGSPVRLRLLDLLRSGGRSVDELAEAAGVSLANSSQHLQHLRAAGLVVGERRGQRVEYRLAEERVSSTFAAFRELAEAIRAAAGVRAQRLDLGVPDLRAPLGRPIAGLRRTARRRPRSSRSRP